MEPMITTASGNWFDFTKPQSAEFSIEDIAHSLSHTCRFAGHCTRFYSVAQHSIWVSKIVPPEEALAALMHDAAEAFVGDMVKPLKEMMADYQAVEDLVERAVRKRFGLPLKLSPAIKKADLIMLATERRDLMPKSNSDWAILGGVSPLKKRIRWCPMWLVRWRFLRRYRKLKALQQGAY